MEIIEQHRSPDGFLRLIVVHDKGGDISIGFDNCTWHTHADILASFSGLSEAKAIREFLDSVIGDHQIIAIARVNGEIREAWVTDDPRE